MSEQKDFAFSKQYLIHCQDCGKETEPELEIKSNYIDITCKKCGHVRLSLRRK